MTTSITTERRDNVLICHIDDGKANALSQGIMAGIKQVIDDAEADPEVGAVVLNGREGKFSAGFDLSVMTGDDLAAISALVSGGGELVRTIYGSPVPVVAACTGHALAGGALLLLACDVRIGADVECKIGLPEANLGMLLPDWAVTIATERLSRRHVQRSVLLARITNAKSAVDVGFLDEVVAAADVLDVAVERASELAVIDRGVYSAAVRKLRGDMLAAMDTQVAADRAAQNVPGIT